LWVPSPERIARSRVTSFIAEANRRHGLAVKGYRELHAWSTDQREAFWTLIWDYGAVIGEKGARGAIDRDRMPGAKFFPDAKLNFAENLLRRGDDGTAIVFRGEDKKRGELSWAQLQALVSRLQQAMKASGIAVGDRVAAMLPNIPEAIAAMLAATSIGAIWSSCSPDFGERGVLDRFGQIAPKLFLTVDGYWYNGKAVRIVDKLKTIVGQLESAATAVIVSYLGEAEAAARDLPRAVTLDDYLKPYAPRPVSFERLPFNHPVYILYSSGTTGVPKCIVHGAGGTLLQLLKEHQLQCDIRAGECVFYFTTLGWMMWNWLSAALASEATILLYDGSPFAPNPAVLWDFAEETRMNVFGTSAKYIDGCAKVGLTPGRTHDLSALRLITSTGSPLAPESFDYVYRAIKADLHLPRSPAEPTSSPASSAAIPPDRCGRGKFRPPASAWRSTCIPKMASRCVRRRANSSAQSRSSRCR